MSYTGAQFSIMTIEKISATLLAPLVTLPGSPNKATLTHTAIDNNHFIKTRKMTTNIAKISKSSSSSFFLK